MSTLSSITDNQSTIGSANDVLEFLIAQPPKAFQHLISSPAIACAVLRSLTEIERLIVLRLLHLVEAIRLEIVAVWLGTARVAAVQVVRSLMRKRLLEQRQSGSSVASGRSENKYSLNAGFQAAVLKAVTAESETISELTDREITMSLEILQTHSNQQWHNFLVWICDESGTILTVGPPMTNNEGAVEHKKNVARVRLAPTGSTTKPCEELIHLSQILGLQNTPIVRGMVEAPKPPCGFSWTLQDGRRQAMALSVEMLRQLELGSIMQDVGGQQNPTEKVAEVLAMLFSLAQMKIGQPQRCDNYSPLKRRVLRVLYDIGMIYTRSLTELKVFWSTPSARLLYSQGSESGILERTLYIPNYPIEQFSELQGLLDKHLILTRKQAPPQEIGMIVESNFKIFAYTRDTHLISILSYLTELRILTPVMLQGIITKESIQRCLNWNVSSSDILNFMECRSHESVKEINGSRIPENISCQIRMWEHERNRVKITKACVFEFNRVQDLDVFPQCVAASDALSILAASYCPTGEELPAWKEQTALLLNNPASRSGLTAVNCFQANHGDLSPAPCIAIHRDGKNEMTRFIRLQGQRSSQS